jgi:hypothetical protein
MKCEICQKTTRALLVLNLPAINKYPASEFAVCYTCLHKMIVKNARILLRDEPEAPEDAE